MWTSDNTDPADRLAIKHGFSQLHPARVMAAWVTESLAPQDGEDHRLVAEYVLHGAGTRGAPTVSDCGAACVCRDTGRGYRGAVLLHHGLRTGLGGDLDATVLRLRRTRTG
ncbi:hypothetical protein GCM10010279_59060 [Streptomyces mutabilis]|nr:hypothetical protein GCM10010279_59060 [Streptomyces mutabilis]